MVGRWVLASGAHSLPKACGAAALRLGANLLAPNLTQQPTEMSVKESIWSKSSEMSRHISDILAKNGGCNSDFFPVVVSGKCVHDKVAEAVLPPLSH